MSECGKEAGYPITGAGGCVFWFDDNGIWNGCKRVAVVGVCRKLRLTVVDY